MSTLWKDLRVSSQSTGFGGNFGDSFFSDCWSIVDRPRSGLGNHSSNRIVHEDVASDVPEDKVKPMFRKRNLTRLSSGDDIYQVMLEVSNFSPSDLSVKLVNDTMVIVEGKHGERKDPEGFVSREFTRKYNLPHSVSPATIECYLSADGVLVIRGNSNTAKEGHPRVTSPTLSNGTGRDLKEDFTVPIHTQGQGYHHRSQKQSFNLLKSEHLERIIPINQDPQEGKKIHAIRDRSGRTSQNSTTSITNHDDAFVKNGKDGYDDVTPNLESESGLKTDRIGHSFLKSDMQSVSSDLGEHEHSPLSPKPVPYPSYSSATTPRQVSKERTVSFSDESQEEVLTTSEKYHKSVRINQNDAISRSAENAVEKESDTSSPPLFKENGHSQEDASRKEGPKNKKVEITIPISHQGLSHNQNYYVSSPPTSGRSSRNDERVFGRESPNFDHLTKHFDDGLRYSQRQERNDFDPENKFFQSGFTLAGDKPSRVMPYFRQKDELFPELSKGFELPGWKERVDVTTPVNSKEEFYDKKFEKNFKDGKWMEMLEESFSSQRFTAATFYKNHDPILQDNKVGNDKLSKERLVKISSPA